jgi:hypothetical protein
VRIPDIEKLCVKYTAEDAAELRDAAAEDDKNFAPAMLQLIQLKEKFPMFKSLSELDIKRVSKV